MSRSTWTQTWRDVATAVSRRSSCDKRQVGAIIVAKDNAQHWVGYNGPPARLPESMWSRWGVQQGRGCGFYCPQATGAQKLVSEPPSLSWPGCPAVHAEINALMKSDPAGREGGTAYVTAAPCWKCAVALANSGIAALVCPPWEDDRAELGHAVRTMFSMISLHVNDQEWTS